MPADPQPKKAKILTTEFAEKFATTEQRAEDLLAAVRKAAERGLPLVQRDRVTNRTLNEAIQKIDELVSRQLAAVMQRPEFQKVEGAWRGLKHLVDRTQTGSALQIKVVNISKERLLDDFESATTPQQSLMWRTIYESEFDQAGGAPFGAIIGDFQFTHKGDDISLLRHMAYVSKHAHCPFITSPSPDLFGLESFSALRKKHTADLDKLFTSEEYVQWRSFRESEDSKYVVMAMPRVLARLPYSPDANPIREFSFDEIGKSDRGRPRAVDHEQFCWMNAAYAMGACITRSFQETGWCLSIRGEDSGGRVEDLPIYTAPSVEGDLKTKCPTEILIPYAYEKSLSNQGFLPLVYFKRHDHAVFYSGATVHKVPDKLVGKNAVEVRKGMLMGSRLPCVLAVGRLVHAAKVMAYNKIGDYYGPKDVERFFNNYVAGKFVLPEDNPDPEKKRKFPFREASIEIVEGEDAGSYSAKIQVRPFLAMEELKAAVTVVSMVQSGENQ